MDHREIGCEDGRWIELAHDRVQWQALVQAVLNLLCSATGDLVLCQRDTLPSPQSVCICI